MRKAVSTMRDFSGGQINAACLRSDETPEYRTAARQMSDWLIEPTKTLVPRPGRRLVTKTGAPRVEYARLGSTDYAVAFDAVGGQGRITIYKMSNFVIDAQQASSVYAWTMGTLADIYMCVCDFQLVICFPGMRPQLAIRAVSDGSWTFGQFAFRDIALQSQQPFYRTGVLGATMSYDNVTGVVNLVCSAPYFTQQMVGNTLSIIGQQVQILSVQSHLKATAQVLNRLPDTVEMDVDDISVFLAGQEAEVTGDTYALTMEISSVIVLNKPIITGQYSPTRAAVFGPVLNSVVSTYQFNLRRST